MKKERIIGNINNMIQLIKECPEYFSDGIDIELLELLKMIRKYITYEEEK